MYPTYQPYQSGYQNPYQPYVPQVPTVAPTVTQSGLSGHLVASQEDIKPNDVPMNGQAAYFPSNDGKVIFAKAWNPDGSITTVRYVPDIEERESAPTVTLTDIADQLQDIRDLLKPKAAAKRTTRKAVDDE